MPTNDDRSSVFTPEDQLHLLQLQARRAIAERAEKRRSLTPSGDAAASSEIQTVPQLPQAWRLVREHVRLHAWQAECLPMWLNQLRGTIKVATGGGKTVFALAAAQALQHREPDLRVVIVVPTIPLMLQWADELRQSNLPRSAIGLMGGGHEVPALDEIRILVCVLASARDRLPKLARAAGWSERMLLVVDECHRANAEQARRIFESKPAYTLGLSATPEDLDDDQMLPTGEAYAQSPVGQGLGPILYAFTLKQCLDAGLLTPFELWHVGVPLGPSEGLEYVRLSREISDLRTDLERGYRGSKSKLGFLAWCQSQAAQGSSDAQRFILLAGRRKQLLYRARARVDAALGILRAEMVDSASRAILFHESIDEVEEIFTEALRADVPAVIEHSEMPAALRREGIEAFRQGIARVVVSAKSLVEGFNVPSADVGIIVASSASVRQRIQSLGRLLRRKEGGRTARVYVLFVARTEDESIYEKVDWDAVVGTSVNRYFLWTPSEGAVWPSDLHETNQAPRRYLPPSTQVDIAAVQPGSLYPGRGDGLELKVDQAGNLRIEETKQLVTAPQEMVDKILENAYRRARLTPAGHVIVRLDDDSPRGWSWRYVGPLERPELRSHTNVELRLAQRSGRRVIARKEAGGEESYAKGPDDTVKSLLKWAQDVGTGRAGKPITRIFWDGETTYWSEIAGERIDFEGTASPLEF